MRRILLTLALVCAMTTAFAQAKTDSVKVYCSLQAPAGLMSSNPQIDYGKGSYEGFRTAEGRKAKSMTAALNYLSLQGWKTECAYYYAQTKDVEYSYIVLSKWVTKKEAEEIAAGGLK